MYAISAGIEVGDILEFGELSYTNIEKRGPGLHFRAVSKGDREKYVILSQDFDGEIDVPESAKLLDVANGPGVTGPRIWYGVPQSEYGDSE